MKTKIFAAIAGLALAASPASAVVTSIVLSSGPSVTSSILASAPTDVQTLSGSTLFAFTERADFLPVGTGGARATMLLSPSFASSGHPDAATRISTHFFVFAPTVTGGVAGTVTFSQNIVGLQRATAEFGKAQNLQFRAPGTSYNIVGNQGTEGGDTFTFLNAKTLQFSLSASSTNKDVFSIITAVPESPTWVMLIAGFGLVGFSARRRRVVAA